MKKILIAGIGRMPSEGVINCLLKSEKEKGTLQTEREFIIKDNVRIFFRTMRH